MPVHACRRGRSLLPVILRGLLCVGMLQLGEVHYTYGHAQDEPQPPHQIPWETSACPAADNQVPQWILKTMRDDNSLELAARQRGECMHMRELASVPGINPPEPPSKRGPSVSIDHVAAADLTPQRLYLDYVHRGRPVIISGALGSAWVLDKAQELVACCREEHGPEPGGVRHCEPAQPAPHLPRRWALCHKKATFCGSKHFADLQRLFDFGNVKSMFYEGGVIARDVVGDIIGEPADGEQMYAQDGPPVSIFWGMEGDDFGHELHFDQTCEGSLSIQYTGTKTWMLWPPWDVGGARAHTRHEGSIGPGEILFFPPGWFHTTKITEGESLAGAYYTHGMPMYGQAVANHSLWKTPMGYETCAAGPWGWRAQGAVWERSLLRGGADESKNEL